MTELMQSLYSLLNTYLIQESPVLSGNMRTGIEVSSIDDHQVELVINAPFYDMKIWNKTGAVVYTGASYGGITDYAMWVNRSGAFNKHNKSQAWANRAVVDCVKVIAAQYKIPEKNIIVKVLM